MHERDEFLAQWRREHSYLGETHGRNEGRTGVVLVLTLVMMAAEIAAGSAFHSMALLADGWHMGSHAAALGLAGVAYFYARRHAGNDLYSFGTGKMGDLAGFSSALLLLAIAVTMAWESVARLLAPVAIAYNEALAVATLGLFVNLISAWILGGEHSHGHGQAHDAHHDHEEDHDNDHHDHDHGGHDHSGHDHGGHKDHHRDHNFRAVYVHVLADAVTSLLAIAALFIGRFQGWTWLDPAVGIIGSLVIAQWAWSLIRTTSQILLDAEPVGGVSAAVRRAIENEADNRIADLHVWRIGPGHMAAVITVVTHHPRAPGHYKALLDGIGGLSHVTVEVEVCDERPPRAVA